jgi:hypothetical protein
MTNKPVDSAQDQAGAQGASQLPSVSADSAAQPSSAASGFDLESVVREVVKRVVPETVTAVRGTLREENERAFQSVKDSRLRVLDNFDPELFRTVADYVQKAGGDPVKATREATLDAIAQTGNVQLSRPAASQAAQPSPAPAGPDAAELENSARGILSKAGITDEAEQTAVMSEWKKNHYSSWADAFADLSAAGLNHISNKFRRAAPASAAGVVPTTPVSSSLTPPGPEDKLAEYNRLVDFMMNTFKSPNEFKAQRAEAQARMNELEAEIPGLIPRK